MDRPFPKFDVIDDETVAMYRSMTYWEKIQKAGDLNREARERAAVRLKQQNPDWTSEQIQAEIAQRMLSGDEEFFK